MSGFGEYISQKRIEQNITQKELAEMLHVSASAVSKWERGIALPHVSFFPTVAAVLNVPAEELYALTRTEDLTDADGYEVLPDEVCLEKDLTEPEDPLKIAEGVDQATDNEKKRSTSRKKRFLFAAAIAIVVGFILIFTMILLPRIKESAASKEPVLRVAEEYFTTEEPYFNYTNIYYVHIEYDGVLEEEFLKEYKVDLSAIYSHVFDKADLIIVSFYNEYKTTASPEFKWVLLPDNKGK